MLIPRIEIEMENHHHHGRGGSAVVAIECLTGSSKAEEWNGNMAQTGDIVEQIKIGSFLCHQAPFKSGKSGLQRILHESFKRKETSIQVRARRGGRGDHAPEVVEFQACIVPDEKQAGGKKQYVLRSISDPNYAIGFTDRTENECVALLATRSSRVVCALSKAQLQDGYVSYPWEKKMQELLPVSNSSCFLSLLILPKASDRSASRYHDLDDTLARANAWLHASQQSGVPIAFLNIQTESLLTKISGETASCTVNAGSLSDLSNLANASLYGFEDYHGVDIGVVRAVRLWYTPLGGEVAVEINLREGDSKLGFAISRTNEGFIYISSVINDEEDGETAATRSGLVDLYKEATQASKFLVVSRVSSQRVLPWMVSSTGAIRCFDTISLSQKLSLHRHALRPILLHVFMWDRPTGVQSIDGNSQSMRQLDLPQQLIHCSSFSSSSTISSSYNDGVSAFSLRRSESARGSRGVHGDGLSGQMLERDTAGDSSFRFHDFSLSNNWV
ncbi:hypothetical protein Sjap_012657 [Stephania japonica]|uniref:Uncharacterized protein n=1 Tax=Stephania japonica TaxID=461633 RepID=A0AAP0NZ51_9MAGN